MRLRWLTFAAACAAVSTACAIDVQGLAPASFGDDGAVPIAAEEASTGPDIDAAVTGDDGATTGADAQNETSSPPPDATGGSADGAADDAAPGDGSTTDTGTGGEGGTMSPCDQDGDGHAAKGSCGGDDCCDEDAKVHPGQGSYFAVPGACGGFDYDCDGKEEQQYGGASCTWSTFSCSGNGFAAPIPGCGQQGTFTSCSVPWYNVFSCTGTDGKQAQGCR